MMKEIIISSMVNWIEENSDKNITIDDLSIVTGYSNRSLHNFFKEKYNITLGKYIRQRRLSRSAMLLRLTSQSITHIALSSGFDSVQSYSREFKKAFGLNPRDYRRNKTWYLAKLQPKLPLGSHESIRFDICWLPYKRLIGQQSNYQLSTSKLPAIISPQKGLRILKAMRQWRQDIYCTSSFAPCHKRDDAIAISSFIGIQGDKVSSSDGMMISSCIEPGKYIKFDFTGNWEQYQVFSLRLYMEILSKHAFVRRIGHDIERFSYINELDTDQTVQKIKLEHYIPIE
ncbi:helix-turn-helix domain-containing protein [Edwardsiella tarda]|uniref:helix-turn-helix domain-containing protein n=1 Tax=Edwardsiella tarda TaxID=636 RepID=UPI000BE41857|nr:helix-turn-helix domain-containing protein [Edwardsiella tarda]ATI63451.1 transcriptional regulator [Edwardsiella tarda]